MDYQGYFYALQISPFSAEKVEKCVSRSKIGAGINSVGYCHICVPRWYQRDGIRDWIIDLGPDAIYTGLCVEAKTSVWQQEALLLYWAGKCAFKFLDSDVIIYRLLRI